MLPRWYLHNFKCWRKKYRSSHPEVFLVKGVLKICNKLTGDHPCRSVIPTKLQSNFIEITLRRGCTPVNLLHIFRTSFTKSTCERLLLKLSNSSFRFWRKYMTQFLHVPLIFNRSLEIFNAYFLTKFYNDSTIFISHSVPLRLYPKKLSSQIYYYDYCWVLKKLVETSTHCWNRKTRYFIP